MRGRPRKTVQLNTLNVQPEEGIIMLLADDEKVEMIRKVIASIKTTFRGTKYTLPWRGEINILSEIWLGEYSLANIDEVIKESE